MNEYAGDSVALDRALHRGPDSADPPVEIE
jgi:hypothetical protein